ncbi:Redoxin [Abortiporus biennis]|nr:Redoxin [Abortiporus biennis]
MASILASATKAAHSTVTSLLEASQVTPGSTIPTAEVKENAPDKAFTFEGITGKNVFIGVPGAFTTPCNGHIPPYIQSCGKFKEKGVKDIYVVAVNDAFVTQAWKKELAPDGTEIRFIADDTGAFIGALGMLFDASSLLGAPRSKRFVIITEGDKITHVAVEPEPAKVTVTGADKILALL